MPSPTSYPHLAYRTAASSLPPENETAAKAAYAPRKRTLVVLDDDPTGTQTVHDITVLTTYESDVLRAELEKKEAGFFVLTNSRAYPHDEVCFPNLLPYRLPRSNFHVIDV